MRVTVSWLLGVAVWTLLGSQSEAAAPPVPQRPEPLQGAVVSGRVLTTTTEKDELGCVYVWMVPLRNGGTAKKTDVCGVSSGLPTRWSVGHRGFWVGNRLGRFSEWLNRCDLSELLKGRAINDPEEDDSKGPGKFFTPDGPANDVRSLSIFTNFESELFHDCLAVGRYRIKQFVLTNVRGRRTPFGETEELGAYRIEMTREEENNPVWSLTVHGYEGSWDKKRQNWKHGKWVKEETIEVGFREPFRVLARGDDYYFLTDSGRLFRAAKPARGKHRKLVTVWDDWSAPITAFVTDADRSRTFLFCDKGPKSKGGPCVFELADGVRLRPYDQKLFRPGDKGPDRLRKVVGYARVLEALGYVEDRTPVKVPTKDKRKAKQ